MKPLADGTAAGMRAAAWTAPGPGTTAAVDFFETADGARLRYGHWSGMEVPRGTVVLLPGRGEFIERYEEVATEWGGRGFAVVALEWRGQGLSSRCHDDPGRCHVASFDPLAADLAAFLDRVVTPRQAGPAILLAHSMGAAIALHHLCRPEERAPQRFAAGILSAPMLDVITDPFPRWMAAAVAHTATGIGFGPRYAWGQQPYHPVRDARFENNPMTGCPVRFARFHAWYRANPALALGGVTFGWLAAAFRLSQALAADGSLERVRLPVLMLSAPGDRLVPAASHVRASRRLPDCLLRVYPDARHEPFMERDGLRAAVWRDIDAFLAARLDGACG